MNIKKMRQDKKLTQWEVAKMVGVSVNAVVMWERGVSQPKPENMEKLKEALEVK